MHICFGPFTIRTLGIPNLAHICHNTSTALSLSILVSVTTSHCSACSKSVPVEQFLQPGVRANRPVSDNGSASSSKPPRSNISRRHIILFGRLQQDPVSSTLIATLPSVDIARLTDRSTATSETRLHRLRRSQISGTQRQGRYPYLSVLGIPASRSA